MQVLALEKQRQQLEVESQSLTERLSRTADQQKGTTLDLAVLMLGNVKHLPMVCSPRDGARPFLLGHQPTP